jgi:broad specificity phosphatase PhoE
MSEIYFIRHGQASFGQKTYDRLSELGVQQARVLASHLFQTEKSFDAFYCGRLERQQKTLQALIDCYRQNGRSIPELIESDAFNEYDSMSVWQTQLPGLLEENPELAGDVEKISESKSAFQKVFARVMHRWASGRYDQSGDLRWSDFKQRVNQAISDMMQKHGAKKRLLVSTSGGPISVAVQLALELSDPKTMELSWQIMNGSITRFKYNHQGIALAGFNEITHLEAERRPELLTYR